MRAAKLLSGVLALTFTAAAHSQSADFSNWPKTMSPQEIGKRVAEHFATGGHMPGTTYIGYPEVVSWYGALTFSRVTHDDPLQQELIHRFDPLYPGGAEAEQWTPKRHHVDDSVFGVVPLEIAVETKDPKALALGKHWADRQWENPPAGQQYPEAVVPTAQLNGLSPETRYWIDDMYMLTMLQLEAYRATGDKMYLDRDAKEMVAYLEKLQQPNGLFFHGPDSKFFWGRGDGWVAAGMAEVLRTLPADHPQRARIMKGYKLMMSALLKNQGPDGMWHQLIDHQESWEETSSSAMFTYAIITGVKHGWLDAATYGPAARKGWLAIAVHVDQHSDTTQVCVGTAKGFSTEYYLARPSETGNMHGQAAVLWAATALLRDEK
jgi:rhamnogalacturonyl hydrolase YesR